MLRERDRDLVAFGLGRHRLKKCMGKENDSETSLTILHMGL